MVNTLRLAVLAVVCWLGGCAAPVPPAASPAIDWARAPEVLIRLNVLSFQPGLVTLQAGQPVRLVFENDGVQTHDFVTRLFGTVASRPGRGLGTRAGGLRVILQVADQMEYDIVPQVPGTYPLYTVMYEPAGAIPPARIVVR